MKKKSESGAAGKKTSSRDRNGNRRVSVLVSLRPDVLRAIDAEKELRKVHRGVVIDEKVLPGISAAKPDGSNTKGVDPAFV